MNETACEKIDRILKERHMSRRQLAIRAGISPSSLQSAMKRNKGLSLDMAYPISRVLDIKIETICNDLPEIRRRTLQEVSSYLTPSVSRASFIEEMVKLSQQLNETGRRVAIERVKELCEIPRYQEEIIGE